MLKKIVLEELKASKERLRKTKKWPKSLSGACNVSSIVVYSILKKYGYNPILVNNDKHTFNIISFRNKDYVIDLTAAQISRKLFPEEIVIKPLSKMVELSKQTIKGKKFYKTEAPKNREIEFFAKGSIEEVLTVQPKIPNDAKMLYSLLCNVIIVENLKIDTNLYYKNEETVNNLAKEVINELAAL